MCLYSGTQYQTLDPQNTSRLSRVDGQNDFQSDFSTMVLTTNDPPTRGLLPPLVSFLSYPDMASTLVAARTHTHTHTHTHTPHTHYVVQ